MAMATRFGHRTRWTAVWVLLVLWFVTLMTGTGGGLAHLFLVFAVVVLLYELLAVDRPA
jgi:hypothetical protein